MVPGLPVPGLLWRVVAGLVVAVILFVTGDHVGAGRIQQRWDHERAELDRQRADAEHEARQREQLRARLGMESANEKARLLARANADAVGARSELGRLRQRLAALSAGQAASGAGAAGGPRGAATAADVLGECSGRLQELAGQADGMSVQVTGLQGWIRAYCPATD
jgi:hypothetical protein